MTLNVIDLFCGCGGMSQGLKTSGMNIIAGIDIWDKAIESYRSNHDHTSICEDITKLSPELFDELYNKNKLPIHVLVGGPPCQGFSMAGKRDPTDPRNSLFMEYGKYLKYFQPEVFVMENVMGILTMRTKDDILVRDIILETFNDCGYDVQYKVLKASRFGVPQMRRRVIFLGTKKGCKKINFPQEDDEETIVAPYLLPRDEVHDSLYLSQKAIDGIMNKKTKMKEKGYGYGAQFINPEKPCYTIPARYWKDGYDALVSYNDGMKRRLSILELKRIQSFPDDYILCGSKKDQIIQLGNAVPCKLAFRIGTEIRNALI